jgi:hypothetical protein
VCDTRQVLSRNGTDDPAQLMQQQCHSEVRASDKGAAAAAACSGLGVFISAGALLPASFMAGAACLGDECVMLSKLGEDGMQEGHHCMCCSDCMLFIQDRATHMIWLRGSAGDKQFELCER